MRQVRRGLGSVYLRGGTWWVRYSHRGQKIRESSGSEKEAVAVKLLKKRLGEIGRGRLVGPAPEKITLADLKGMVLDHYAFEECTSAERAQQCLAHVDGYFGTNCRALDIMHDRLVSYIKDRREAGAALGTIKYELALLRLGFNLAVKAGKLPASPLFPSIEVSNVRKGFFEEAEFRAVLAYMKPAIRPVAEFLYWTGWRCGEALGLEWRNVEFNAGVMRIDTSKIGEPRTFPFKRLPALETLLRGQHQRRESIQAACGKVVSRVFTWDDGEPIHDFRRSWGAAFEAAGLPRRIPHDLRRTAARNLSRAGVPERTIMALCGWKTRSVFDRYRIVNEADLSEGLAKLASAVPAATVPVAPKVVDLAEERAKVGRG